MLRSPTLTVDWSRPGLGWGLGPVRRKAKVVPTPQRRRASAVDAGGHAGTAVVGLLRRRSARRATAGGRQNLAGTSVRRSRDRVLVIGPPRSGKTSSLVVPSVLDAPAAVVSTSTKPDVLKATTVHRGRLGRCFLFDPLPPPSVPGGCTSCVGRP